MKFAALCLVLCAVVMCGFSLDPSEISLLKVFYQQTGGPYWYHNDGWSGSNRGYATEPCTDWYGVKCSDDNMHVTSLSLANNNLTGQIPSALGGLQQLISLDFSSNHLYGSVPMSEWDLSNMYALSFKDNQLEGEIDVKNFPNLQFVHFDFNKFSGSLDSFCNCPNLKVLGLTNNSVSGSIPDCFASMTQLQTLQLGGNALSGAIPTFSAQSLRGLDLSHNSFSGTPPIKSLQQASGLNEIVLFQNKFTGSIAGLSQHPSMVVVDVSQNMLTGSIPDDYATSIPNLMILNAQYNSLSGLLPSSFTNSTIATFDFTHNSLSCPLPKLPPGGHADCGSWTLTAVNPSRCSVGEKCLVVVNGFGFVTGQMAFCVFGDAATVGAIVVSPNELRCAVSPFRPAKVDLTIAVNGVTVTNNSLPFEFARKEESFSKKKRSAAVVRASNADPVNVRIHGMSKCPDFGSIMTIFKDIVSVLGTDVMNLDLGFIMKPLTYYPMGFWSLHGQSEVIGNGMIMCAENLTDTATAVYFAACLAEDIDTVPVNAPACAQRVGLDYSALRQCVFSDTGKELLNYAFALSEKDSATWSPTIVINDEPYCLWHSIPCKATKDSDFLAAICQAYQGPTPEACKSTLARYH